MNALRKLDIPIIEFKSQQKWENWLEENFDKSTGIWIRFYKKGTDVESITYPEAVDVALCYGWIDSQVKSYDEKSYLQKFTPRKSRSPWSQINIKKVEQLIKDKRMRPAGLLAIEVAKKNGNWENAYGSPTEIKVPEDFQKALNNNSKAKEFFETLSKTQKFYFIYPIIQAKRPETREKRIQESTKLLEKGQKKQD